MAQSIPPILPFEDEHIHEAPNRRSLDLDPARNPGIKFDVNDPITPPVMVTDSKQPWQSKINGTAAVVGLVSALELFSQVEIIKLIVQDEALADRIAQIIASVVLPLMIIYLRTFHTGKPTTLTKSL